MIIQYKGYTLKPGIYAKDRFDLLKTEKITMKDMPSMKKKYGNVPIGTIVGEKDEELAYDMLFENALQKIVLLLLAESNDVTDLKGWMTAYKKEMEEIKSLLK